MKNCPNCKNQLPEDALYCPVCGTTQASSLPLRPVPEAPIHDAPQLEKDPFDHTGEFDMEDVTATKLLCMAAYLLGFAGIIIALLAARESPYTAFHVRQSLKFTILEVLLVLTGGLLVWTVLIPILCGVCLLVLLVCKLVSFAQVCKNQAKEPLIIRNFSFLN